MTIALIDADIVAYMSASSCEKKDVETGEYVITEPLEIALARVHKTVVNILEDVGATEYKAFLSGDNNFRNEINPEYKANRKDVHRPEYLNACKEYLVTDLKARVTDGYEADDALGINQTEDTIICSIDKDLMMIPGDHYSWPITRNGVIVREATLSNVSELDGIKTFYRQMLIGDTSDNIIGVSKIGKVRAAKIIDGLETEKEMFDAVFKLYVPDIDEFDISRFWMNADCLWILRNEGERFTQRYANTNQT